MNPAGPGDGVGTVDAGATPAACGVPSKPGAITRARRQDAAIGMLAILAYGAAFLLVGLQALAWFAG